MNKGFTIAIDGPVAAGKGTVATRLARELKGFYLYTGSMYRCVALFCLREGVDITNPAEVANVLQKLTIAFHANRVLLNGEDVTDRIIQEDAANGASVVAVFPHIRENLVSRQQYIAKEHVAKGQIVVSEGRDTGTKVFPDAALKIYLTAAPEIRAKRRQKQFEEKGRATNFEEILAEVKERDTRDKGRETDPLPSHPEKLGYVIIDDSQMTEQETLSEIKKALQERNLFND